EAYVVDLQRAITALFAAVCDIDHKIFSRRKYHALVHLTEDVRRFGPAVLFATETFESFNPIVRVQLAHTNRHAPSKDVSSRFARARTVWSEVGRSFQG
ncbi:hypothetical protein DFS34DRAFT_576687, partial [Phlyctochytrium arcticum]